MRAAVGRTSLSGDLSGRDARFTGAAAVYISGYAIIRASRIVTFDDEPDDQLAIVAVAGELTDKTLVNLWVQEKLTA
jgi:hypothetical protein